MKSKIILDYSGTDGKNGDYGNSYSGGKNGSNGESARPICLRLFTFNDIITISEKSGFSDVMSLGLNSNSVALLSNGGKGGQGGNGGKGFNGVSGSNGFNATQYSSGTSGGNGGNGGNGTDGGNGGQGGNGGSITLNVNYEETDLLMLVSKHEENFGSGGKGGVGGPGGSGGLGGRGGSSYSWTESVRNHDGTYSYVSKFN